MKEIKAYIHAHRIADVIHTLKASGRCAADATAGCRNLSVTAVQSLLNPVSEGEQHYSMELAEAVINECRLELLCDDDEVDELLAIIERSAHTGLSLSGWAVVTDVVRAVPLRRVLPRAEI